MNPRTGDPLLTLYKASLEPRSGPAEVLTKPLPGLPTRTPLGSGPPAGEVTSLHQRLFHPCGLDIQGPS